jgi:hypothetical protein
LQSRHCTTSARPPVHFCSGYFGDEVLQTICLGWAQTLIIPISTSQVPRITGMRHQHLAIALLFVWGGLLPVWHVVSHFASPYPLYNGVLWHHGPETIMSIIHRLKSVAKITLCSLKILSQIFAHS